MNEDERLQTYFDELRAADVARATRFEDSIRPAGERRRSRAWRWAFAALLVAGITIGLTGRRRWQAAPQADSISEWRSPTESLLRPPSLPTSLEK
jgi:hypothetical protein